jgi:hypothetical protein
MIRHSRIFAALIASMCFTSLVSADVEGNFDDQDEGVKSVPMHYAGVTYRDVNQVNGIFPDGSPMTPAETGTAIAVEEAVPLYGSFPTYGSPNNALTFGAAYINGPNLTIGALSSVWMDLDAPASAGGFDIAYYENGPWGTIVWHLDALSGGNVVASSTHTIAGDANGAGRDNPTFTHLSVSAASFDSMHLYATFNGQYTAPRGIIDDVTLTSVPEPMSIGAISGMIALSFSRFPRRTYGRAAKRST